MYCFIYIRNVHWSTYRTLNGPTFKYWDDLTGCAGMCSTVRCICRHLAARGGSSVRSATTRIPQVIDGQCHRRWDLHVEFVESVSKEISSCFQVSYFYISLTLSSILSPRTLFRFCSHSYHTPCSHKHSEWQEMWPLWNTMGKNRWNQREWNGQWN